LIVRLEAARIDQEEALPRLLFWAPLPWLLYLDFAVTRAHHAEQRRASVQSSLRARPDGTSQPSPARQSTALDAVGEEAASVLFSYAAIEAFANQGLWWKGADHRFEYKSRGVVLWMGPAEAERRVSLARKVWRLLPEVMERAKPPDGLYREFQQLERLRHAISHAKQSDRWGDDRPEEERTMGLLLRGTVCGPRVAAAVLGHFFELAVPDEIQRKVDGLRPSSRA
jgi:hypothetical protein